MKRKIRIKWKIFIYMLAFTGILIAMLWILQTIYLEDFYKMIKMNEVDNAIENVCSVINDDEIDTAIDTIGQNYDMMVALVKLNGVEINLSGEDSENYIGFISVAKGKNCFGWQRKMAVNIK